MDQSSTYKTSPKFGPSGEQILSGVTVLVGGVLGYVALVPTLSVLPGVGPYNEKRALQIGLLILVGAALLLSRDTREHGLSTVSQLPRTGRWGLGLVLVGGILSSLRAPASFYAFVEVGHFLLLFVTAGVVATAVRRAPRQTERWILGTLALSAGLYAVFFAVGYGMHLTVGDIRLWPEGGTNYVNIRNFNHVQTWTLPLLGGLLLAIPKDWKAARGGAFGIVALWWSLIFASNVRGTVVAMAVAALAVVFLFRRHAKPWLLVQVAGLIAGILLYYVLFSTGGTGPPVVDKFSEGGYMWRIQRWITSLEMGWAHPWLGAGPMHYAWPPYRFATGGSPHNALMQWIAEWGFLSTGIMSGLAAWGGSRWMWQEKRAAERASDASNGARVALVASIVAAATHAMVSGLLVTPISQILLAVVAGWAWGRYRHEHRPTTDASGAAHAMLCVVLIAAMGIVGSSLKDLATVEERRDALLEAVDRNRFSPRYWAQGFLHVRDPDVIERARRNGEDSP